MKIYTYNPTTKEFLLEVELDIKPDNNNQYSLPANSTTKPPLTGLINQVAIFKNNKWIIENDFRGQNFFNTLTNSFETIDFIGDLPANYIKQKPVNVPEVKSQKINQIKAAHIDFLFQPQLIKLNNQDIGHFMVNEKTIASYQDLQSKFQKLGLPFVLTRDENKQMVILNQDVWANFITKLEIVNLISYYKKWLLENQINKSQDYNFIVNFDTTIDVTEDDCQQFISLNKQELVDYIQNLYQMLTV